jgi:protein TonB
MKTVAFTLLVLACVLRTNAQTEVPLHSIDTTDRIFIKVEIESEFPGGPSAWLQFLNTHMKYPKKAVKKEIQGMVVLQFIVGKDGSISNAEAISGDPVLREEALRVIKKSPKWVPASQDGKLVRSYKKQPIIFRLEE